MANLNLKEAAATLYNARLIGGIITPPLSAQDETLTLDDAYTIAGELLNLNRQDGHLPVGRKVGFAGRALLRKFGLSSVVWGDMYDNTVLYATGNNIAFSLVNTVAPKIEPEIVVKLRAAITEKLDNPAQILESVEWIAQGLEIVDCPFPGWQYKPLDFVCAWGFHHVLLVGTPRQVTTEAIPALAEALSTFPLKLHKSGEQVAAGSGKNVLANPMLSLSNLADALTRQPGQHTLEAGELVSTGTITDPQFVAPGEEWTVFTENLGLPALTVRFTA